MIKDGVFKELCLTAQKDPAHDYAIFIDEINRGNVSAIFGELITLIENDKRLTEDNEITALLPYSQQVFGVPSNLFIIGTMNTADRSVEALDTALRRRFTFREMLPQPKLLSPSELICRMMWKYEDQKWEDSDYKTTETKLFQLLGVNDIDFAKRKDLWGAMLKERESGKTDYFNSWDFTGVNLQNLLEKINQRIEALIDRDHTIGHAYFMNVGSVKDLQDTFARNIIPLLQEYFYGDYTKMAMVIGSEFFEVQELSNIIFGIDNTRIRPTGNSYRLKDISDMKEPDFLYAISRLINPKDVAPQRIVPNVTAN